MTIPSTIAVVDFLHMLTVNFKARANDAGPNDAGQATLDQLAAVRNSVGQEGRVVVCVDSPPYKRRDIYPEYKKGRDREPEFVPILNWTLDRLERDGYQIARAPGAEADDVVATLAKVYAEHDCRNVMIVTQDKDMCQCLTPWVRMFVPILGRRDEFEIRDDTWVTEHFANIDWKAEMEKDPKARGPFPCEVPLMLAIMGDTSDHIPGIKGIGPKGAAKLISTYGTLEKMAEACSAAVQAANVGGKLSAFWRNYNNGMAAVPKWLQLTTLDTEVQLEKHPLKYLEVLPIQQLVAEDDDIERDAIQAEGETEFSEPDWDSVAQATEAAERAALAAALPVDPPKPLIGADPNAADILKQKAAERAAKASPVQEEINAAATEARQRAAEGKVDSSGRPKASTTDQAAPTKPASSQSAADSAGAASAPAAAEVVPQTQGPKQPRKGDTIDDTALALRPTAPNWALTTQPASAKEMLQIATTLFNSPMFRQFGSERGNFAIMSYGRELGLGYMQSLMSFCQVKERPFMWAHAMRGLVLSNPVCEYLINTECTAEASTWITRRRGWPEGVKSEYRFTYEEAVKIGLTTGTNRENWIKNPRSLVDKTASSRLLRQVYADILGGIHAPEESD